MSKINEKFYVTNIANGEIIVTNECYSLMSIIKGEAPADTLFYVETTVEEEVGLRKVPSYYAAYSSKDRIIVEAHKDVVVVQEVIRRHNAGESFYDILSSMK